MAHEVSNFFSGNEHTDEEYIAELERLREIAVHKGRKDAIAEIDFQLAEKKHQVKDSESVYDETLNATRAIAKFASLGIIDDDDIAGMAAQVNQSTIDYEKKRIQEQDYMTRDNTGVRGGASVVGALATGLNVSRLAGAGVTKLGTFARQGGAAAAEGVMSMHNMTDMDYTSKQDLVQVVNMAVLAGGIGGAAGALTMRNAVDWGSTPSGQPGRMTKEGGYTAFDDAADAELESLTAAAHAARPQVMKATREAKAKMNEPTMVRDPDAGPFKADEIEVNPVEWNEGFSGLDKGMREYMELQPNQEFSLIKDKPWDNAVRQRGESPDWRNATNAGELFQALTRGLKDQYEDKITGVSHRLMRRVSEQVGGRYQVASQAATMELARDIRRYVEPIDNVLELNKVDPKFQELLMDFGADSPSVGRKELLSYVFRKLGPEDAKALDEYLDWSRRKSHAHLNAVTGMNIPFKQMQGKNHLHTKLTPEARAKMGKDNDKIDDFDMPDDPATKQRTRNWIINPDRLNPNPIPKGTDYEPVLLTDLRRHMNNEKMSQVAKKFDMPKPGKLQSSKEFFEALTKKQIDQGINPAAAEKATDWMKENMLAETKSPELWIQALNSVGYAGSLAGPKSALLNLHDPFMGAANFEVPIRELPGALKRAYTKAYQGKGFDAQRSGIDQNVGEFTQEHMNALNSFNSHKTTQKWWADRTRDVTDKAMKVSQFERLDLFSKNATLNLIHEQFVREARSGALKKNWGFYLDPKDFSRLENALKKHGSDASKYKGKDWKLLEDMAFAALGQQQLISSAGRSAAWARNPNLRPMWALRGFATQQQGVAMKKILDAIDEGDPKKAYRYLGNYAVIAGTSFGLLNESRQWLMGDGNFELKGILMGMADQIVSTASVNTIGLNDYQWGRMMENGIAMTFMESLVPIAVDVPMGIADDVIETLDGNQGPLFPLANLPIIKQPITFGKNMNENIAQSIEAATLGNVDVRPYYNDPQEEVMKKMGMLRQRNQ